METLEGEVGKLEEEVRQTRRESEGYRDRMEKLEEAVGSMEERGGRDGVVTLEQMEGVLRDRMKEGEHGMKEARREMEQMEGKVRRLEEKLEGELRGLRDSGGMEGGERGGGGVWKEWGDGS